MVHGRRYTSVTNREDIPRSAPETTRRASLRTASRTTRTPWVVEAAALVVGLRKSASPVAGSTVMTGSGERYRAADDATADHRAEHADTDELDGPVPHRAVHPAGLRRGRRRWGVRIRRRGLRLRRRLLLIDRGLLGHRLLGHGLFGGHALRLGRLGGRGRAFGRLRGAAALRLR